MAKKVTKAAAKKTTKAAKRPKVVEADGVINSWTSGTNNTGGSTPKERAKARPKYSKQEMRNLVKEAGVKREQAIQRDALLKQVGAPHGVVRARAGTGKTFTLVVGSLWASVQWYVRGLVAQGVKGMFGAGVTRWQDACTRALATMDPQTGKMVPGVAPTPSPAQMKVWQFIAQERAPSIRYVAFSKAIVEEFSEKYKPLVAEMNTLGIGLSFSTMHSLGLAACKRAYKLKSWKDIGNKFKTKNLLSVLWECDLREVEKEKGELIEAIDQLVHLCKITLAGLCGRDSLGELPKLAGTTVIQKDSDLAAAVDVKTLRDLYDNKAPSTYAAQERWRGECVTDEELEELAVKYDVDIPAGDKESCFRDVRVLLDMSREHTDCVDFDDMIWLPIVNNLRLDTFDLLIVDEGQDLNRCQQEVALRAGRRIIMVGDDQQAIYGFAGADTESISHMIELLRERGGQRGVETDFALLETRRCGKAIVRRAQKLVPDFQAHESNPEGEDLEWHDQQAFQEIGYVPTGWERDKDGKPTPEVAAAALALNRGVRRFLPPKEQDMVLCRVNAPLVGMAFRLIKDGRPCNIKGRDIGQGLKSLIKKSKAKDVGDFLEWLGKWEIEQAEKIRKYTKASGKKDCDDALVTLSDKVECLKIFAEGATTIEDMNNNIDRLFGLRKPGKRGNPEPISGTLLSSIHRAKGLEAKRVFILRPDLLPHPMAKTAWAKEQEKHLEYVAVTRAIKTLVIVRGE